MGGLLSQLACCACCVGCKCLETLCSCACSSSTSSRSRTNTFAKLVYGIILTFFSFVCLILRVFATEFQLEKLTSIYSFQYCEGSSAVELCVANGLVYRISFALTIFFLIMACISSCSWTAHTSFLSFKFMIIVGFIGCTFAIPEQFFIGYAYFARVCSAFFLLIQVVITIDSTFQLKDYLNENDMAITHLVLTIGCACLYVTTIALVGVFYACDLSYVFLTITVILCFIAAPLGVLETEDVPAVGILPVSAVSLYAAYLYWSSMSSSGDPQCNPAIGNLTQSNTTTNGVPILGSSAGVLAASIFIAAFSLVYTVLRTSSVVTMFAKTTFYEKRDAQPYGQEEMRKLDNEDAASSESETRTFKQTIGGRSVEEVETELEEGYQAGSAKDAKIHREVSSEDDESDTIPSTLLKLNAWFHLVMLLGSIYMSMLFSNWGEINFAELARSGNFEASDSALWVKISSQWVALLLFMWLLVAPHVCQTGWGVET